MSKKTDKKDTKKHWKRFVAHSPSNCAIAINHEKGHYMLYKSEPSSKFYQIGGDRQLKDLARIIGCPIDMIETNEYYVNSEVMIKISEENIFSLLNQYEWSQL